MSFEDYVHRRYRTRYLLTLTGGLVIGGVAAFALGPFGLTAFQQLAVAGGVIVAGSLIAATMSHIEAYRRLSRHARNFADHQPHGHQPPMEPPELDPNSWSLFGNRRRRRGR